jgi:hypothetical protein
MKNLAATVVLFGFLSLTSHCSLRSTDNSSALNQNKGVAQKHTIDETNGDEELRKQYVAMEKEVGRAARDLGLETLSESSNPRDEIRVWIGFGIIVPKCLVMTRIQDASEARFLAPKVRAGNAELDSKGDVVYAKNILAPPKSGWQKLYSFLNEQGISSPMRLVPDPHHIVDPDETYIVIEAHSGTAYSMVFFPKVAEETDAKKALAVCRTLESEFAINMGCGDSASSQ